MLDTARFTKGQKISLQGKIATIRLFEQDLVVVQYDKTNISKTMLPEDIYGAYNEGVLHLLKTTVSSGASMYLENITTRQAKEIKRRERYLKEQDKYPKPNGTGIREKVIKRIAEKISDPNPPGVSLLSDWRKNWIAVNKDTASIVITPDSTRKRRIEPEIIELMHQVIDMHYLKKSKPTKRNVYQKLKEKFDLDGYQGTCPSESSLYREIDSLTTLKVIEGREGRTEARTQSRVADQKIYVYSPLERVEVDTAHFNLGLLNDEGYYVGKPSIYFVEDVFSRAIIGFCVHVGKGKEEPMGAIQALHHAIMPKSDRRYPMYGLMGAIVRDSGPAYRAKTTENFMGQISRTIEISKTRMGYGKPFVERFIGTIRSQLFSEIDGYLGKYDRDKYSDDTLIKSATITVKEFHDYLYNYIVNEYHHEPHEGLRGKTPYKKWVEGIQDYPPMVAEDIDELALIREHRCNRTACDNNGFTYKYERFHSVELAELVRQLKKKNKSLDNPQLTVFADPSDASAVSVVNPFSHDLFEVPNVDAQHIGQQSFAELNARKNTTSDMEPHPLIDDKEPEFPLYETEQIRKMSRKTKNKTGPEIDLDKDEPFTMEDILNAASENTAESELLPNTSIVSEWDDDTSDDEDDDLEILG